MRGHFGRAGRGAGTRRLIAAELLVLVVSGMHTILPVPAWARLDAEASRLLGGAVAGNAVSATRYSGRSWALEHGTRLFTAAGRDVRPYANTTRSSSPAPATDREILPTDVVALPEDAFAFADGVRGRWYRVDRSGVMTPLPWAQWLDEK